MLKFEGATNNPPCQTSLLDKKGRLSRPTNRQYNLIFQILNNTSAISKTKVNFPKENQVFGLLFAFFFVSRFICSSLNSFGLFK